MSKVIYRYEQFVIKDTEDGLVVVNNNVVAIEPNTEPIVSHAIILPVQFVLILCKCLDSNVVLNPNRNGPIDRNIIEYINVCNAPDVMPPIYIHVKYWFINGKLAANTDMIAIIKKFMFSILEIFLSEILFDSPIK